ncbi:hypothetical protein CPC08DRAFT_771540 [Agrocybe pediades]|nr:hypothetical protein CPC08DRAFT_771540 [Agrocybe pediades]
MVWNSNSINIFNLLTKAWEVVRCGEVLIDTRIRRKQDDGIITGYYEWGLDAGHHQDNWNPSSNLAQYRNDED